MPDCPPRWFTLLTNSRASRRQRRCRWGWLGVSFLLLAGISSCIKKGPRGETNTDKTERCNSRLEAAFSVAQPEKLGQTSRAIDVVHQLNDWQRDCRQKSSEEPSSLGPQTRRLMAELLSEDELNRVERTEFDDRDVRHIRNSLLLGAIRDEIVKRAADRDDELGQTVDVFYYVVRNVELIERRAQSLPVPLFQVLQFGRGTAEDRAWVFAALLRQLQIPAVILTPTRSPNTGGNDKPETPRPFLIGVLLNERVYLFDPRLGLPLSAPDADTSTPLIRQPATLEQFTSGPSVVDLLETEGHSYPLRPEQLKQPRVQLVGHRSVWAPRMNILLNPLIDKCIVYENLDDGERGLGLVSRVADFAQGRWTKDDIRLWPYPENVYRRFVRMTDEQRALMTRLSRPFRAPFEIQRTKAGEPTVTQSTDLQFASRVSQLKGRYEKAVRSYQNVRLQSLASPALRRALPVAITETLETARDDASFWIGVSQYEQYDRLERVRATKTINELKQSQLNAAIRTLAGYLDSPNLTGWKLQARYVLALSHLGLGNHSAARTHMRVLKESDHPQAHGFALLWKRWMQLQREPVDPPGAGSAAPPNEDG